MSKDELIRKLDNALLDHNAESKLNELVSDIFVVST